MTVHRPTAEQGENGPVTPVTVRNTGTTPVTLDSGRVIGGGEWASIDDTDELGAAAIAGGRLTAVEAPADTGQLDPDAAAAFEATAKATGGTPGRPGRRTSTTDTAEALGDTPEEG